MLKFQRKVWPNIGKIIPNGSEKYQNNNQEHRESTLCHKMVYGGL